MRSFYTKKRKMDLNEKGISFTMVFIIGRVKETQI